MSTKKNRLHWQLPVLILACMELAIFSGALLIAEAPHSVHAFAGFEGGVGAWPRVLLFLTTMTFAMAAMGLYNLRQVLTPVGMLLRIAMATTGASVMLAILSRIVSELSYG